MSANASEATLRRQLADEVARIVAHAAAVDQAEDAEYGDDRGDDLPRRWRDRSGRAERIKEALAQLERDRQKD